MQPRRRRVHAGARAARGGAAARGAARRDGARAGRLARRRRLVARLCAATRAGRTTGRPSAWGYHFPVHTRFFSYVPPTPNLIVTAFVAKGLAAVTRAGLARLPRGAARRGGLHPRAACRASCDDTGQCFGYVPGRDARSCTTPTCWPRWCSARPRSCAGEPRRGVERGAPPARASPPRAAGRRRLLAVLRGALRPLGRRLPHRLRARGPGARGARDRRRRRCGDALRPRRCASTWPSSSGRAASPSTTRTVPYPLTRCRPPREWRRCTWPLGGRRGAGRAAASWSGSASHLVRPDGRVAYQVHRGWTDRREFPRWASAPLMSALAGVRRAGTVRRERRRPRLDRPRQLAARALLPAGHRRAAPRAASRRWSRRATSRRPSASVRRFGIEAEVDRRARRRRPGRQGAATWPAACARCAPSRRAKRPSVAVSHNSYAQAAGRALAGHPGGHRHGLRVPARQPPRLPLREPGGRARRLPARPPARAGRASRARSGATRGSRSTSRSPGSRPTPATWPAAGIDDSRPVVVVRPPADMALYHRFENPLFAGLLERLKRDGR